jgi:glucose-6-phosphate 1-dehydrogenase
LLSYVSVNYTDLTTFWTLRKTLDGVRRSGYYPAIPPTMFESVVERLERSGCNQGARVIVEKPLGRDLDPRCDTGEKDQADRDSLCDLGRWTLVNGCQPAGKW